MRVERSGDIRGGGMLGSYPYAAGDPAEDGGIQFHGISEGKSAMMIFERYSNLKYKYGNRHFWATGESIKEVCPRVRETGSDRG